MDDISTAKRKKTEDVDTSLTKKVKAHKKKKEKKEKIFLKSENNEDNLVSPDVNEATIEEAEIKTTRNPETDFKNTPSSNKPKKIIFVDDEPHEVSDANTSKSVKANKKKMLNDDEEDVKDEDIDKFCEEIDDEDNKQYEDWIKQIEATLHPKKKK